MTGDALAPSAAWQARLIPPKPETAAIQTPTGPRRAAPTVADIFAQRHTLTSIIVVDDGGAALADDKVLQVGDRLDGFTLIELTETAAVFQYRDIRAELRLPDQSGR